MASPIALIFDRSTGFKQTHVWHLLKQVGYRSKKSCSIQIMCETISPIGSIPIVGGEKNRVCNNTGAPQPSKHRISRVGPQIMLRKQGGTVGMADALGMSPGP